MGLSSVCFSLSSPPLLSLQHILLPTLTQTPPLDLVAPCRGVQAGGLRLCESWCVVLVVCPANSQGPQGKHVQHFPCSAAVPQRWCHVILHRCAVPLNAPPRVSHPCTQGPSDSAFASFLCGCVLVHMSPAASKYQLPDGTDLSIGEMEVRGVWSWPWCPVSLCTADTVPHHHAQRPPPPPISAVRNPAFAPFPHP
jgi:hypothetical protein